MQLSFWSRVRRLFWKSTTRGRRWLDLRLGRTARRIEQQLTDRMECWTEQARPGQFSFLTTIYVNSDPALFRQTVDAVLGQTTSQWEWIILAHGPLAAGMPELLKEIETEPRIRVLILPENRGIIGGLRYCLEQAAGEYVIPLDGDDLPTRDALQMLAQAVQSQPPEAYYYTDEDLYIDDRPCHPFLRPDWDPILNLSSSYIWHLTAFRRDLAIQLGVYSDAGCEYCHDWDTVTRFAQAGYAPKHLKGIAYHWRRHASSLTHRAGAHQASLESQKHFLQRQIDQQPQPELYQIEPFPLSRGTLEWHIARKPISPQPMAFIHLMPPNGPRDRLGPDLLRLLAEADYPLQSLMLIGAPSPVEGYQAEIEQKLSELAARFGLPAAEDGPRLIVLPTGGDFRGALRQEIRAEFVAICAGDALPRGNLWAWEALKLFELFPEVSLLAGRLIDSQGFVTGGGAVFHPDGHPTVLGRGAPEEESGPFGMALKPHTVDLVDDRFFLGRTKFLKRLFFDQPPAQSERLSAAQLWPLASEHHILSAILRELIGTGPCRFGTSPLIAARAVTGN